MHLFFRSWISIKRQTGKVLPLFLIVFLLGLMVSSALSVSQAINRTDERLRQQLPAIATVIMDYDALDEYIDIHGSNPDGLSMTPDIIEKIGNLPYVRLFDYAVLARYAFFSQDLVLPMDPSLYSETPILEEVVLEQLTSMSLPVEGLETFLLKGVYNYQVADIEAGLITLIEGRTFTEGEMENGANHVALVSQAFTHANDLVLGDVFTLESSVYYVDTSNSSLQDEDIFQDEHLVVSQEVEFEIVGIFTPTAEMTEDVHWLDMQSHMLSNARIYVPMQTMQSTFYPLIEEIEVYHPEIQLMFDGFSYQDVVFVLYDPLYLEAFSLAAAEFLSDFWMVNDLTNAFEPISASMQTMQQIAGYIVLGAIVAALIVLGLLMMLFLRDRKEEMGIYLALGEHKKNIIGQMIIETAFISCLSIIIALFAGNLLASHISEAMLVNDLAIYEGVTRLDTSGGTNDFNEMGFAMELSVDEMLEAYSVSLDATTILWFFGISVGMILLSTTIPTMYILKLNPKDILMKGSIG